MTERFIHSQAICESEDVGEGTRVWAFAHVLMGARIGRDCNICDGVFVEGAATIGDRVTVKCGVQVWDGVSLGDDVFVGPNATFTNDRRPRSRQRQEAPVRTQVCEGASIGANATILPGLEIGAGAMVGAGAVVTRSVPPNAIVVGNPARITGYVESHPTSAAALETGTGSAGHASSDVGVAGAYAVRMPEFSDLRGRLTAGDLPGQEVPFAPRRWFFVYGVPSREVRGEHAHRVCEQFLICVAGSVSIALDDGVRRGGIELDAPTLGLYVPPLIWGSQYRYEPETVLLVLASHPYDPDDYIRDYGQFRQVVGERWTT